MDGLMVVVPDRGMLIFQREKLGMTQEEVAVKAGIKLKQYQRYENHESAFSTSSLRIVNAVLTALELDTTAYASGEYALRPVDENDPNYKFLVRYMD